FLTVLYAVVDQKAGRITFANAGHPHAFLVSTRTGEAVRLEATRPPLGLANAPGKDAMQTWARREGIICLFTDGVAEALGGSGSGERFGEERVLGRGLRVIAIEKDRRLAAELGTRKAEGGTDRLTVVHGDALHVDWQAMLVPPSAFRVPHFKVIGNIPYAITSPLIDKALTPPL